MTVHLGVLCESKTFEMNSLSSMLRRACIAVLCFVFLICWSSPTLAESGKGNMGKGGVTGTWTKHEDSGVWTSAEVGLAADINGYYFELECFDEGIGYIDCLPGLEGKCTLGPDGRSVWWYSGLLGTPMTDWQRLDGGPWCVYSVNPYVIEEIEGRIATEFQERPIASSVFETQPNPHSLVGMENNMYLNAEEQTFDMTLLEQDIRIVATPTEFEWRYGDGTSYGPVSFSGTPLPPERLGEPTATSHAYSDPGDYQISVIVYYSGTYSINGGPMIPIDGRAQVESNSQTLRVWKSESQNVADDCLVNPAGFGC
ncbi:hypothetical protein [Arthrobacter sunyaminii]|uniref:PKD domain-containing protein n=1 Tax=Arthrobacter sunyaminii TaxID=2816859 RepID=A0A975XLJ0_9MICC|nr:hypothetical protein [Arthrobacter sunyaminii]MBO0907999.1 hypothetical protein [Arthrobacter sunyaminii]QWQ37042.1 hypothetical protein KG104_04410 [Arthrobacter sunyaminii]